jgi:hypothetical protein
VAATGVLAATAFATATNILVDPDHADGYRPDLMPGATRSARQLTGTIAEEREITGAHLLAADLRLGLLLANEARHRTIERLFGVSRDQANLLTLIALGVAAQATHDQLKRMLKAPGGPNRGDTFLAVGVVNGLLHELAGESADEVPFFGPLVALALVGSVSRPYASRLLHDVRSASQELRGSFRHRYGHLVQRSRTR